MNELKKIRDPELLQALSSRLQSIPLTKPIMLMEVCGTHTMAIHRAGLPALLPPDLKLLSGPGCPVCVTPASYLDTAAAIAREHNVVLATFGDMVRVPGSTGTLYGLRSEGYPVEIVYSPLGAVELAERKPETEVVFLAVGFETTVPAVAASIMYARYNKIENFSILSAHKLVIPALNILISDSQISVDGFILPGHVSTILGCEPYRFIAEQNSRACVITGFETADIIQGILMLIDQIEKQDFKVEIQYSRVVKPGGNERAFAVMNEVFIPADSVWRGFGVLPMSGLVLRDEFARYDAAELTIPHNRLAFSTDTLVVKPIFFPGGDIGSLAVCGTVNDVLMKGAKPLYLSLGIVLEEGFLIRILTRIVESIQRTSAYAGVKVVTGDTKVVGKGEMDGICINTSGIGSIHPGIDVGGSNARVGDAIIVSGDIGAHGIAVMVERNGLKLKEDIKSDAAPLTKTVLPLLERFGEAVHVLRDPTRGGIAATLNEIAVSNRANILLDESAVPVSEWVLTVCDLLGFDPLYLPCEGRFLAFVDASVVDEVLSFLKSMKKSSMASKIGYVERTSSGEVLLRTLSGGQRILDMPSGELLPRIC